MRKHTDEMTPEERRAELRYQEDHFQHLVSGLDVQKDTPKTWYRRWWRKWSDLVTTTAKIILWTVLICVAAYLAGWFAILCATSL